MQHPTPDNRLETLLALYNQEIDKLKEKLLNGETWEATKSIRNNITKLGITLQRSHNYILTGQAKPVSRANFPQETIRPTEHVE